MYTLAEHGTIDMTAIRAEIKTVLRIRPLLKKERDDVIALEPSDDSTAVLHPQVVPFADSTPISSKSPPVKTGHDVEFHFDRVLSLVDSQGKLYQTVGQPLALDVMESLKQHASDVARNHLIIATGLPSSGKLFALTGPHISQRKSDTDGLVPRIVDSLFAQARHNLKIDKKVGFVVKISIIQVNQAKGNPSDCELFDLLQRIPKISQKRSVSGTSNDTSLGSAVGSFTSSFLSFSSTSTSSSKASNTPRIKNHYAILDEPLKVQQDLKTSECLLTNSVDKECNSAEEARELIQKSLENGRHVKQKKKYQSHLYFRLQPMLVSRRTGRTVESGRTIALLHIGLNESMRKQRAAHLRNNLPDRSDAYTAVMYCLKALQHNSFVSKRAEDPTVEKDINQYRKVPFLQHKVCMLLQPLFIQKRSTAPTEVILLVAASPSGRDYVEKKIMMQEIVDLHKPSPVLHVATGTTDVKKISLNKSADGFASTKANIKDEGTNAKVKFRDTTVKRIPLSSTEEDLMSLPPPIAPTYNNDREKDFQKVLSPAASAPIEEYVHVQMNTAPPPPIRIVDFPGVLVSDTRSQSTPSAASSRLTSEGSHQPNWSRDASCLDLSTDALSKEREPLNSKFRYMESITKVVHKGRQVMERMSASNYAGNDDLSSIKERLLKLEEQNAILQRENESLRKRNQELLETKTQRAMNLANITTLRKDKIERDYLQESSEDDEVDVRTHSVASSSIVQPEKSLRPSTAINSTSEVKNASTIEIEQQKQFVENPLLQYTERMQSKNNIDERENTGENTIHLDHAFDNDTAHDEKSMTSQNDENDPETNQHTRSLFDDPLYRHMAMMNNME